MDYETKVVLYHACNNTSCRLGDTLVIYTLSLKTCCKEFDRRTINTLLAGCINKSCNSVCLVLFSLYRMQKQNTDKMLTTVDSKRNTYLVTDTLE